MTLLWSSAGGSSERGSCDRTLQNFQDAAFARTDGQQAASASALNSSGQESSTRWSSGIFGMGNPFRPHTRQSRSPSRPSGVRRASSMSSSHQQHHPHHHHHQQQLQYDPAPSPYNTTQYPTQHAASPVSTPDSGERSTKRLKLTVRKPAIASAVTRRGGGGGGAKKDDTSSSYNPRPPTRLTVTEPNGKLLQTTNGVQKTLHFTEHGLQVHNNNRSRATTAEPPQGTATRKTTDRRSLRSHDDGPRLKSELAVYFPDYEDIIYDAPKELEILTVDSVITICPDPEPEIEAGAEASIPKSKGKARDKGRGEDKDTIQVGRQLVSPRAPKHTLVTIPSPSNDRNKFNGAQVIDFSSIERSVGHHPKDPLTDAFYFKSHRRAERKEKQLRNIEKERAMHEKAQLERLLDGLEGHDWLRVMGITGVTDSEARKFESKRNYFVSEVRALLLKFKTWKEEERRLKIEKEAALAAEGEGDDEEEAEDESESEIIEPMSSDFDSAAARQLQLEASSGAKGKGGKGGKGSKSKEALKAPAKVPPQPPQPPPPVIYRPPTPEGPFTSFYSKPHIRAAALGKSRHGRNLTAFGLAIPEPEEREFALPRDYITPEAIKESARRRRRMKRESVVDGGAKK